MRQVLIHSGENGFWVGECPSLPACVSQGETREEAIRNIKEAVEGYLFVLMEDDLPVSEDKNGRSVAGSMSELPRLSGKKVVEAGQRVGFKIRCQHGSHVIMRREVLPRNEWIVGKTSLFEVGRAYSRADGP